MLAFKNISSAFALSTITVCSVVYNIVPCILSFLTQTYFYLYAAMTYLSRPVSLRYSDTYFPSWGSIKSYLVSSYLVYTRTAGGARQTLMELQKQDDLCAFFSPLFCSKAFFYQNKDERFHLISVKNKHKHHLCPTGRRVACQIVIVCWFIYFISVSRCYKFIIHPALSIVHTLLLCPYNPVSMTTRISSIRPGRGMICELRVKSHAPA